MAKSAKKSKGKPKARGPAAANRKQAAEAPKGPQPKILRIGVIQAGKIVEEKLVRRRDSVSVGASPRNTIVVPASSLPRSFTLFEMTAGQYSLVFSDSMDGRVSVANQVMSLDQVRQGGHAQPKPGGGGKLLKLQLSEASRGKVLLGEVTLLFQFVAPPPIQPRPQLPPSVRGGFFTQMDWTLATSFVAMAVINFGFIFYLRTVDIPRKVAVDVIPDDFAEYVPTVEKPKKTIDVSKLAKTEGEKKVEKKGPKKVARGKASRRPGKAGPAKPCDAACQAAKADARRARLAKAVAGLGALKLLGSKGKGGKASNLLGRGDPGRKLDSAFKGVSGLKAGGRGGRKLRGKGGGGSGKAAGVGDLGGRVGGPGKVGTGGTVAEKVPKAIVKNRPATVEGTLNKSALNRKLRAAARGVKMCYERALKRNPGLSGKISVRIEINAMGRVTAVHIEHDSINDPGVASCVKATMKRQRFPAPEGGPAEVLVPFVFQSSK